MHYSIIGGKFSYYSTAYKAESWSKKHRFCIKSTREAKNGFYFDKTDSPNFLENHTCMMVSLLAHNLVNFMKTICLSKTEAVLQVDTLRLRLFKVVGKLVRSSRRLFLKLSFSHVY